MVAESCRGISGKGFHRIEEGRGRRRCMGRGCILELDAFRLGCGAGVAGHANRRSRAKKLAPSLPSGESDAQLWRMKCSLNAGTSELGCRLLLFLLAAAAGGHHLLKDRGRDEKWSGLLLWLLP